MQALDQDARKYEISQIFTITGYAFNKRGRLLMKKIRRNDPCPCGSGKKYKKCCLLRQTSDQSFSWADNDGIHFAGPGSSPSPEQLKKNDTRISKADSEFTIMGRNGSKIRRKRG
jgi:hypothetical protein